MPRKKDIVLEFLDNHKYSDPVYNRFLFTGSTISRENPTPNIPIDTDIQSTISSVTNSAVLSQGGVLDETPLSDSSQPSPTIPSLGLSQIYPEQSPPEMYDDDDDSSTISAIDHIIGSTESEYIIEGDYESSDADTSDTDSVE